MQQQILIAFQKWICEFEAFFGIDLKVLDILVGLIWQPKNLMAASKAYREFQRGICNIKSFILY